MGWGSTLQSTIFSHAITEPPLPLFSSSTGHNTAEERFEGGLSRLSHRLEMYITELGVLGKQKFNYCMKFYWLGR